MVFSPISSGRGIPGNRDIKQLVPVADVQICDDPSINDLSLIEQKILNGYVMLTIETELKHLYPPRVTDMKDVIIRLPFQMQSKSRLFCELKFLSALARKKHKRKRILMNNSGAGTQFYSSQLPIMKRG
ncbi:hypothetical protein [Cytobacillus sp. NCCP-133]|uniref:hypothetical protein n=1 Tax=Cytobacillus sp. NCCP-133 TaxID=766848 RepID=UPI002231DDA7|nr:hypothetical protein [Cytobacillus sp. NCCP-133]GLB61612.1 hypothetical protein NCCP133_37410 [Cytobacillus sp. NCCP-133]